MHPEEPDKTSTTDDERVSQVVVLPPPEDLIRFFPIQGTSVERMVGECRTAVRRIVRGGDDRLLVVIGPCSIHDPRAALDYAQRLATQRERFRDTLEIVMRVYFEKPRTTVGWKGLINDPYLDESCRINEGLRIARSLLIDIARLGVPAGSELLDTMSPQYLADLVAWGAIGARTTESQVHRELASGLSMPVGIKNRTDGDVGVAIDAIRAAAHPHWFPSLTKEGSPAILRSSGNPHCCLVLRGGNVSGPNFGAAAVNDALQRLQDAGLEAGLVVDCSHGNSGKDPARQAVVAIPTPFIEKLAPIAQPLGLDLAWVYGLIRQESRFIMNARSSVGASGLMQLMPATARFVAKKIGMEFDAARINELEKNLTLGANYLAMVHNDLENSPPLATAAYNAGPGRPRNWRSTLSHPVEGAIFAEIIPFTETRTYVKNVLANATIYAALIGQSVKSPSLKERLGLITPQSVGKTRLP